MKRWTRTSMFGFAALLLLAGTGARAAEKKFVLKLAHADSPDRTLSRKAVQSETFARELERRSQGRIEVRPFSAGALGGEREITEGVKSGFIQAGLVSGVVANFFPPAMITDIPYLFPSEAVAYEVLDGPFGKRFGDELLAATGMRNLCFGGGGFRSFTDGKAPIRSAADMKGRKVRVQETPMYITMMKALGAQPTPIAWTETYTALQTGVVDGHEQLIPSIVFAKIYEVQKHLTLDQHSYSVDWFLVNDRFLRGLPSDLQQAVADSARVACAEERRANAAFQVSALQTLKERGVQIYTPNAAELATFKDAAQKPCVDWLKTKVDEKLIASCLQAVKDAQAKP